MSFNVLCFITASNTVCVIYYLHICYTLHIFIIILLQSHTMGADNHKQCNIEKHVNQYQKWIQVGTRFFGLYSSTMVHIHTHTTCTITVNCKLTTNYE